MIDEKKLKQVYSTLQQGGYNEDYNTFKSGFTGNNNYSNRKQVYDLLSTHGANIGSSYEEFMQLMQKPKAGHTPMSEADKTRFIVGANNIAYQGQQTLHNAGRYNKLKQRKQKQQKDFGRVNIGTHQTPYGGDANNVVKDDALNTYVTSDSENAYSLPEAQEKQAILDRQNQAYQNAVDTGEIPSVFDVRDKNGNYDLQENIGKDGTYVTKEGLANQLNAKLNTAYAERDRLNELARKRMEEIDNREWQGFRDFMLQSDAASSAGGGLVGEAEAGTRKYEMDDTYRNIMSALRQNKATITTLEDVKNDQMNGFWHTLGTTMANGYTFTDGMGIFNDVTSLTQAKQHLDEINDKRKKGQKLTSKEELLESVLKNAAINNVVQSQYGGDYGAWARAGATSAHSIDFMKEVMEFPLAGSLAKATASKVAKIGAEQLAKKTGDGLAKFTSKWIARNFLKATGILAGSHVAGAAITNTTGIGSTMGIMGQLYTGNVGYDKNGNYEFNEGMKMLPAFIEAERTQIGENGSEMFGEFLPGGKAVISGLEKIGLSKIASALTTMANKKWVQEYYSVLKQGGYNGIIGEGAEEYEGMFYDALTGHADETWKNLKDLRTHIDIWLGVGSMSVLLGALPITLNGKQTYGYFKYKHKVNVADKLASQVFGDEQKWNELKEVLDGTPNEKMASEVVNLIRSRDKYSKEQINAAIDYARNLTKQRIYNIVEVTSANETSDSDPTGEQKQHNEEVGDAYSEGRNAEGEDTHEIQIDQADKQRSLASLLGITEQQLSAMSNDELDALTGQDDNLDRAIYEYQLSNAKYQGVIDNANDKVDMEVQRASTMTDMITDKSRGTVRNATIKATQGAEDYGGYIINGNIATHDDGSINISDSDQMIIYYDPTTGKVEHADANRFASLGDEVPAGEVKSQAIVDAKEKAIKEVSGIIDGRVEEGTEFSVTDEQGNETVYNVLADNGDGTAMVTINGNVDQNPHSFGELQQLKDLEDQKRLEAAKKQRAEMEAQRAQNAAESSTVSEVAPVVGQETTEPIEDSLDYNKVVNDNGNVVTVSVKDRNGDSLYNDAVAVFLTDGKTSGKANDMLGISVLDEDGNITRVLAKRSNVTIDNEMPLDDFKAMRQAELGTQQTEESVMPSESSAVEENRGVSAMPETEQGVSVGAENAQEEQVEVPTFEDGTPIPVDEEGTPDPNQMDAKRAAEYYDTAYEEDAEQVLSDFVNDSKAALKKAQNMKIKGKNNKEMLASREAKKNAIAKAQAQLESSTSIRDAYNERLIAKEESTHEGRMNLIDKAKAKFSRLKSKDEWKNQTQALYNETIGKVLHRLYDGLGVNVFDHEPQTVEEYVSSSIAPYSLNYEGTDTSKGVKQETGLERKDFAKSHVLAAEGKGMTVDDFVHKLWDNRPSQFENVSDQEIRNALLDLITSDMNAYDMQHVIENKRIAQAEKEIEDEKNAAESAPNESVNDADNTEVGAENAQAEQTNEENAATDSEGSSSIEVPEDSTPEKPLGKQKSADEVPFSAKDDVEIETPEQRAANIERNRVDNIKTVDNIVGKKTRKTLERIAKMMGAKIQWQYTDNMGNGWYDADTNTLFLSLDSSITEGVQFIFGHEMTHEIKVKNSAAYDELRELVKDMMGEDAFNAQTAATQKKYNEHGVMYSEGLPAYEEEVVADQMGYWLRDLNYAHTLALKMSHPLLAKLHEIINRIRMAFYGTEYTDQAKQIMRSIEQAKQIMRSIEQAYVQTANREAINAATQEGEGGQRFSLRTKEAPKKTQKVFKLMRLNPAEEGKLFPLFIGSGEAVELGKWYDADSPKLQDLKNLSSKDFVGTRTVTKNGKKVKEEYNYGAYLVNNETGEAMSLADFRTKYAKEFARMGNNPNVKAVNWATDNGYRWIKIEEKNQGQSRYGGENRSYYNYGINGTGSVSIFAMRPGWHAGSLPTMRQIGKGSGKNLRDDNFVWVEGEIPADIDYNEEAQRNADKDIPDHIPTDGFYLKATNANKEASQTDKVGWYVAGAFKPNRIMSDKETRDVIDQWNAEHPDDDKVEYDWKRESGKDFNAETMSLEDTPKFSIRVYHGSGADFSEFDFDHMGEGAGSQAFGWGGYVTSSEKIGKSYADIARVNNAPKEYYDTFQKQSAARYVQKLIVEGYDKEEAIQRVKGNYNEALDRLKRETPDNKVAISNLEERIETLDEIEKGKLPLPKGSLYEVNIPDDNGSNYLDWDSKVGARLLNKINKLLEQQGKRPIDPELDKRYKFLDGKDLYDALSIRMKSDDATYKDDKAASKFLSSLGYTGIKYKAGRNFGGAEEGDTNYVIFKPEDMQIVEHTKFSLKTDNQGNPLNADGTLKLDKIKSVDDLTDDDFLHPSRNIQMPTLPKRVADAIGVNGKPVIIKKNIFERNYMRHKDVTPEQSKAIFNAALYNPDLYGQNQKTKRPYNWVLINTKDEEGKNRTVLLEVNPNKDNVEIVHWYFVNDKNLELIKKQAIREGDQILILPSEKSEEVGGLSNLTDGLSAAKIDNSSETAKENGEKVDSEQPKFSLKDDKTMFGMHNITLDKLRKAIKQGGFAAPSMGVIDSKNGIYSDYGEITLIPKAEKLVKSKGKNAGTFTADGWTPTYPEVVLEATSDGKDRIIQDTVGNDAMDADMSSDMKRFWDNYLDGHGNKLALAYQFLHETGKNPKVEKYAKEYPASMSKKVLAIKTKGGFKRYDDDLSEDEIGALIKLHNQWLDESGEGAPTEQNVREMIEDLGKYADGMKNGSDYKNHILENKKYWEKFGGDRNTALTWANKVVASSKKQGKTDVGMTNQKAMDKVRNNPKLNAEFDKWFDGKMKEYGVSEMLFAGRTPSGKGKYLPNTMENAIKIMKKQNLAGGYNVFKPGVGVFIANYAPMANTLSAMKKAKDKLIPFGDKRHNEMRDYILDEYHDLAKILTINPNSAWDDSGESRMQELAEVKPNDMKGYIERNWHKEVSDDWVERYNDLVNTIKNDYPVFYFETKFMRPYGLDEFEKAIVPKDTPKEVVDALKKAGIDVHTYEGKEDREKVTMAAVNNSDNIRFSLAGEQGATTADGEDRITTRMDNLQIAQGMEEAKKDAKAIKLATGWERGADGRWRYEIPDFKFNYDKWRDNNKKVRDNMSDKDYRSLMRYTNDFYEDMSPVRKRNFDEFRKRTGYKISEELTLGDVLDGKGAENLFKYYPELRDVKFEYANLGTDTIGSFDPETNTIKVNQAFLYDPRKTEWNLQHEVQHAIQGIEGFAKGGNSGTVRSRIQKIIDDERDASEYAKGKLKQYAALHMLASRLKAAKQFAKSDQQFFKDKAREYYWDAMNELDNNERSTLTNEYPDDKNAREIAESGYHVDEAIKELKRIADEYKDEIPKGNMDAFEKVNKLTSALENKSDDELYQALAGEVEARNVQKRMGMSAEERRNSLASDTEDVAREDQIFLGVDDSDDIRYSLRDTNDYNKRLEEWKKKNGLSADAKPMEKPEPWSDGKENVFDYMNRMVQWTRNQNLWKTAPKKTGFKEALDEWKKSKGLPGDAYPPHRPNYDDYTDNDEYNAAVDEYKRAKILWEDAPKAKDYDLTVDYDDVKKQLRNIRRAVLNQKNYDKRTVQAISDLVKKMLTIGWGDGLSRGKVARLLSAAKNATGATDVKKHIDNALGILADNYLHRIETAYDNLIKTKGVKADQSGVIKIGAMDADGQAFLREYKKAMNMDEASLEKYIADIENNSAKYPEYAKTNGYRLDGIQAAILFKQQIGGNDADIAELENQIRMLKDKKGATKEDTELLKALKQKLFENKFDRITMYENLLSNIQATVSESKSRAKEFKQKMMQHQEDIRHMANIDMEGRDSTYYDTTTAKKKFVNNPLQRAILSSTYTFEQFLKFFGQKHTANGEGRLYNYFTKLNQEALDEQQLYNEMNRKAIDDKATEIFGKKAFGRNTTLTDLVGKSGKGMEEMDIEVTDYSNKETQKRTIHLKQGQMLYIYLANKQTDGQMKLRAMGIDDSDVAAIEAKLDPKMKQMGEWLQGEYLPECQRRYQEVHTRFFGAPMKEVENYFPLVINQRARNMKEDVNQDTEAMSQLAGTSTGAIVTRRVNTIPLDIENADAFEVAFNHLQEMEEWSAMLPFRQDINTLLSYTHFRNQVQNMSSVAYGSGKTLWDEFKQTAQIAAGTYKPKVNKGMMDSKIAAAMGGVAMAKISGRLWTAIKQSQSATVFLPECDFHRFVKNGVNPYGSWKWAMENIPDFRKRVESLTHGDVKLKQYLDELEKWHDWTKAIANVGMYPNILVDGITCAVGARSVYETEVNRLTKLGYPKENAEEKAYYKAVAAYNKTQQSSGGMYLSPMQVDRTYVSAALSLFKNANYAYGRMQIEAIRGLVNTYDFWGGKHKTALVESMARQIKDEDGLEEDVARAIAKAAYSRTFRQSIGRLLNFMTLVPISWAAYSVLPYLLTGDDDDKKKQMLEDAALKGFATSLTDNFVIPFASNILNAGLKVEDGKPTFDPEVFRYQNLYINPATSDLANLYSMIGNQKWYSVANKGLMLGVQSLVGFNPETVGALYQAIAEGDFKGDNTNKEVQIAVLKAISAPEESIRELYMDELGLKNADKDVVKKLMAKIGLDGDDITKVPLEKLEKKYAGRQMLRDNLLTNFAMDDETFYGYVDKYQQSFEKKIKDKMDKWDEYDKRKADEFFNTTSDPKLKEMIEKKRAKDAKAATDEQLQQEGLADQEPKEDAAGDAYDAAKSSDDLSADLTIKQRNKVLDKRYAELQDEYSKIDNEGKKWLFKSKHKDFKAYKEMQSAYKTYNDAVKELKAKLVGVTKYSEKQAILEQIRANRKEFMELQDKVN